MTTDTLMLATLGLSIVCVALLLAVLLRKQRLDASSDLAARLGLLEQHLAGLLQSGTRIDTGVARIETQLRDFTQTTQQRLDASRQTLDTKLDKTVEESRLGRAELAHAFQQFETRLEQRLASFQRFVTEGLDASRSAMEAGLSKAQEDARAGRVELTGAFTKLETKLEQRIGGFDASMGQRFDSLHQALMGRLAEATQAQAKQFTAAQADAAQARQELTLALDTFRKDLTTTLKALSDETQASRQAIKDNAYAFEQHIQTRFEALGQATGTTLEALKKDVSAQLAVMSTALKDQLDNTGGLMHRQFSALQETVSTQLSAMAQGSHQSLEQLRSALNERLAAIQADNTAKLEEMRRTVDEKLHATLEQRLGESFRLVSERLEQVHAGLGEMKNLAGSVGDLKRVMTNVRTRGTWGEVQLGAIIESVLTAEQYERNVKTVDGSEDLVEYAIKMPGKQDQDTVWLPIDSKYPVEDYQRLLDAHESADKDLVQRATAAFGSALKNQAKKIKDKYVNPPKTTDFAILFLPTEGLFAEVCRIPGMVETLQNDFRVVVAGPTTLAAMLNSLRLGFRTLAIEKRSSEVWNILASVKTEFRKFGDTIEATRKSIDIAAKKFSDIGVRTRAIERKLRGVEELPAGTPTGLDPVDTLALDNDSLEDGSPTESH